MSPLLQGKRVYFDSNIVIYILEGFPAHAAQLQVLKRDFASGQLDAVASDLTLSEILVSPFKRADSKAVVAYRRFLEASGAFELVTLDREVFARAASYRASFGLRMADALHVASARAAKCNAFLTNDRRLRLPSDIERVEFAKLI